MPFKPLPIGIDNFGKLIRGGYYYVDKTWFIKELLDMKGEVNLFTRPRRFGKSLNLSMLQYYFEDTGNKEENKKNQQLFCNLRISEAGSWYLSGMSAYPVVNLTLKSAKQQTYELAYGCLKEELAREYRRHEQIIPLLPAADADKYQSIMERKASVQDCVTSLRFLSDCLYYAYRKNVIILIDEYDVPLENAWFLGYYGEMAGFLRSLFESALKTNPHLEFAVMSGCLRISKESIFTGLNNLKIISIMADAYGEHFGFLQEEVDEMLAFYNCRTAETVLKDWYDGYLFGNAEVYNPWSVISYVEALTLNTAALPAPYWKNTSSNAIVRDLVERADSNVKAEIEQLIAGGYIEIPVYEDITYGDIYDSEDHLWNFLFFTGYLKKLSVRLEGDIRYVRLAIPNREVRYIYNTTVMNWFKDEIKKRDLTVFYRAVLEGNADRVQKELTALLMNSISYMDGREEFYHGFLLGILEGLDGFRIKSNREAGVGRYDIAVYSADITRTPVILELKISDTYKNLDAACDAALKQIEEKCYDDWLPEEGYTEVLNYGVAFYKKQCRVMAVRKEL